MRSQLTRRAACLGVLAGIMAAVPLLLAACSGDSDRLTVYSGRSQNLIGPLLEDFSRTSGIDIAVRYGGSAELAAQLLEEGDRSPADVYIAQDAGALGAVQAAGLLAELDDAILALVPDAFRSRDGSWVGLSGRARTIVYNTEDVDPADLPGSILEFTDPAWRGQIAWAPTNGSFQAFVTALRVSLGEEAARAWLEGIRDNDPTEQPNNTAVVAAVARGESQVGFVNHYYALRFVAEEGEGFTARNHYTDPGDVGTLINVSGAGILRSSDREADARRLIEFMLSAEAQEYFTQETFEYPMLDGIATIDELPPVRELQPVELDLSQLEDLQGTLELLRDVGVLP